MDEREQCDDGLVLSQDPGADWAEYDAWLDREVAAGRDPDERGGSGEPDDFAPGNAAGMLLTDSAVRDPSRLSDDELVDVMPTADRQIAREQYKRVLAAAEFGRRHQRAFEDARARGVPSGVAPGGFPGEELAIELVTTRAEAGHLIDDALDLTSSRLPQTRAGMAAGLIDLDRASWIAFYTRSLSDDQAAQADQILAAAAPGLRREQVARRAAVLEMRLNPEAAVARKERARREDQRVEARRETSGNASLSAREMATADAIASKAFIDDVAAALREGGIPGTLGQLRVLAMTDLTQGRNPLDRLGPLAEPPASESYSPADGDATASGAGADPDEDPEDVAVGEPAPSAPTAPVPMPALINLTVPVGTLLGWSSAPAEAGAWGLLDRDETRAITGAAARHPRTRWCVTLTGPDGTALAHGCARGQHPHLLDDLGAQAPPGPAQQLTKLLRRLKLSFAPIAQGNCDQAGAEDQYTPSRKLKHLVRARSATCDAPGCDSPAVNADLDHTIPWPDGPTSQANLAPRCRSHHRAKQAPDWKVEQLAPGVSRWTMPSGRTHVTTPTRYDS